MNRNNAIIWIIGVLLMVTAVLVFFLQQDSRYSWYERYQANGEQPYDIKVFKTLLKRNAQQNEFTVLEKKYDAELPELEADKQYNLFAIKPYFYPDTAELKALTAFIERGNNLFVSANEITPLLAIYLQYGADSVDELYVHITSAELYAYVPDSINRKYDETNDWSKLDSIHQDYQRALEKKVWEVALLDSATKAKVVTLKTTDEKSSIGLTYMRREDSLDHYWQQVKFPETINKKSLASIDKKNKIAIAKWQVGKGHLYVCSAPLLFSNYHLQQKDNFLFLNDILSTLPPGDILFDEITRYDRSLFYRSPRGDLSQSPLSFILNQRELAWAWFTLLAGTLLFVLFRSKRRQRIIPIMPANNNSTLAYAKLLGSLQLKEKNNINKAQEIFRHFLQHLRARNRWHSKAVDDELKKKLLKLAPELNREIQIALHVGNKAIKKQPVTDTELINLFNYTNLIIQRT